MDAVDGLPELMPTRLRARVPGKRPRRPNSLAASRPFPHRTLSDRGRDAWDGFPNTTRMRESWTTPGRSLCGKECENGVPSVPPPLPRLGGVPLPPAGAPPNTLRISIQGSPSTPRPRTPWLPRKSSPAHRRTLRTGCWHSCTCACARARTREGWQKASEASGRGPGGRRGRRPLMHFQAIQTPVFTGSEPAISARATDWPEDAAGVALFSIFQHLKKPVIAGSEPEISAPAAGQEIA